MKGKGKGKKEGGKGKMGKKGGRKGREGRKEGGRSMVCSNISIKMSKIIALHAD
ncbi:MAG: hypothetical protein GY821_14625 [Gammaproteobacteria bacterium]|nr:hypothetical protein [Gammaproteobacteria bacterium]